MYSYKAKVIDVYDGDTLTIVVDLGFKIKHEIKLRLNGLNTPEIRTKDKREKELGKQVRDYVRELVLNKEILVKTTKAEKFGRYLADVYIGDLHLNNHLIKKEYARPYFGEKRGPWFSDEGL